MLAFMLPLSAYAINPPPIVDEFAGSPGFAADQQLAQTASQVASATAAGQVVGCQTGGFGGALAQTFGAALQQAIPSFIRGQLGSALGQLASQAGPFGQVIQAIGNIAINRLSDYIQNQIGQLFGGALGGTVGQVVGGIAQGGGVGLAAVPVNTVTINEHQARINAQTKQIEEATQTQVQKDCIGDVLIRKLANSVLALTTRMTFDIINGGFNGDTAIIQNLRAFLGESIDAVTRDFLTNQLSGLCTTQRQTVQTLILTQYQYETSFGRRVQCRGENTSIHAFERGSDSSLETLYESLWGNSMTIDQLYEAQSELRNQQHAQQQSDTLGYVVNEGIRNKIVCSLTNQPPRDGSTYCAADEGIAQTVFTGAWTNALAEQQLELPVDSLLNADEVGEIIDALTASVTQVALQGVDGILGLSRRSGSQGSYLDAMVNQATGVSQGAAQGAVTGDIESARAIEQTYRNTIDVVIQSLTTARAAYVSAIACYQQKANSGINQPLMLEKLNNASTTVRTVIDPQIASLTALRNTSDGTLDQLTILASRAQSALTTQSIIAINQEYTALLQTGRIHSAADLALLQANLQTVTASVNLLITDANAQLTECQAL